MVNYPPFPKHNIFFPTHTKQVLKCLNKKCGRTGHFEIWAFAYEVEYINTGKKVLTSLPVLVCPSRFGCGTFFDLSEYDLTESDIEVKGLFKEKRRLV